MRLKNLLFVIVLGLISIVVAKISDEDAEDVKRSKRAAITQPAVSSKAQELVGKTLNFDYLTKVTNNVHFTLHGRPIDLTNFKVDQSNVAELDKFLKGEPLSERLYVASVLAGIDQSIAKRSSQRLTTQPMTSYELEDEDDIVLDREDVDEIKREIEEDPTILDLNSPAPGQDNMDTATSVSRGGNTSVPNGGDKGRFKRKILASSSAKWPTTIRYVISSDFNEFPSTRAVIDEAVKHWEDETCLNFVKGYSNFYFGSHIRFRRRSGCWSKLGRKGGSQEISIGPGCSTRGIVAHEIGHALGFEHEQSRPDRSNYVTVHTNNIRPDESHNFLRQNWRDGLALGVPYDYASIMHYSTKGFSKNGKDTISAKQSDMETTLGQRQELSFYDVKLVNLRYCNHKCSGGLVWSNCRNGGYRDPDSCNKCRCPDGWTGTYCTTVQSSVNANCGSKYLSARSSWSTFTSPNYDSPGFPANAECTWKIKTYSSYRRVVMQFVDKFQMHTYCPRTCKNYVEVRFQDGGKAGPRYCCNRPTTSFRSHGREMLLLMRINTISGLDGFKIRYRYESCGAVGVNSGPACIDTQSYSCSGVYTVRCGFLYLSKCTRYRQNTCYKEVKSCAPERKVIGSTCYREYSDWSSWSSCTKSCGGCGTQQRTRTCRKYPCRGSLRETRVCNKQLCPVISRTCYKKVSCGVWGWGRCTRSYRCYSRTSC